MMVGFPNLGGLGSIGQLVVVGERGLADCALRCEILPNSGGLGDLGD